MYKSLKYSIITLLRLHWLLLIDIPKSLMTSSLLQVLKKLVIITFSLVVCSSYTPGYSNLHNYHNYHKASVQNLQVWLYPSFFMYKTNRWYTIVVSHPFTWEYCSLHNYDKDSEQNLKVWPYPSYFRSRSNKNNQVFSCISSLHMIKMQST